jgi:hypothetical protein
MRFVGRVLLSFARPFYSVTTALLPSRDEFPVLLSRLGLHGTAVEVGVQSGLYSDVILSGWNGSLLISVDPWLQADDDYVDIANVPQASQEDLYQETLALLAKHGPRSSVWRMPSEEASRATDDASVDFVYLDARHDYESVKADLAAWYRKVRPGGVIAGHDYLDGNLREGVFGVRSAVDEFFARERLPVASTFQDRPWESWLVRKPSKSSRADSFAWNLGMMSRAILIRSRRVRDRIRAGRPRL